MIVPMAIISSKTPPNPEDKPAKSTKTKSKKTQSAKSADSQSNLPLADADTIAHPTWLRELAGALADPTVGAATGNRWYMPDEISAAAMVRYLWNAAAIVQMYCYRIAWGGTLAVKTSVLRT